MAGFSRLRTDAYVPDGSIRPGEFVVVEPLTFTDADGNSLVVPRGFITDFASIPALVQLVPGFDVNGASRPAAVLHDWLYCESGRAMLQTESATFSLTFTRGECDGIFYDALRVLGHSRFVASSMYTGVRTGGWLYWDKARKYTRHDNYVGPSYVF